METRYLFIDGGCLRATLKYYSEKYFDRTNVEFYFPILSNQYKKIFYYDSLPPQQKNESEEGYSARIKPAEEFLSALNLFEGVHVYEGDTRRRRDKAEQKKIDVKITVDMLNHSIRKNMTHATLLTSDLDFKPLIDALVENGMYITLWYPPGKTNIELIHAADSSYRLNLDSVYQYSLPDIKRSYSLPVRKQKLGKVIENLEFIEEVKNSNNLSGELYKSKQLNNYTIIYPTSYDAKSFVYLNHFHENQLRFFFDECFK